MFMHIIDAITITDKIYLLVMRETTSPFCKQCNLRSYFSKNLQYSFFSFREIVNMHNHMINPLNLIISFWAIDPRIVYKLTVNVPWESRNWVKKPPFNYNLLKSFESGLTTYVQQQILRYFMVCYATYNWWKFGENLRGRMIWCGITLVRIDHARLK